MTIKFFSILMVLIGATFLLLSFSPAIKIWKNLSGRVRRKWLITLYLMGFFILGYLSFDVILISNMPFPLELVTGGVFLGGAVFVYVIINISQNTIAVQQKTEEAIIVAKNDWENTFDAVTDMVTIHDIDFNIIRANPAAKAMLGLQLHDGLPSAKCFRLYHGTEKPPSRCASCKSLQTGRPSIVEVFEPHLNKHLEIRAMPRFGSDSRIVGLIHVVRDITERKQAEEALQAGRLQLKAILDNIPYIAWLKDKESRLIAVNEPFGKSCGFEPDDLVGKTDLDIWPRDLAERYRADDKEVMESGKRKQVEEPLKDAEGRILWIETIKTPIYDEHGDISGTAGIARDVTKRKLAEEKLQKTLKSLRKAFGTTIQVMVSAVETRDPYTSGHQIRTANLARAIATEMGLSEDRIEAIRMAGPIHDIGKLSLPAEILSKPGKLSQIEFSLIKEHARKGYEMLKEVESPWPLAEIVYQHHERMDGSGYPRKLKGDEILIEARILAVADVVEAMASHRPYRPGLGIDTALNEIEKNRGIFYDSTVADACLRLFREKGFQIEAARY